MSFWNDVRAQLRFRRLSGLSTRGALPRLGAVNRRLLTATLAVLWLILAGCSSQSEPEGDSPSQPPIDPALATRESGMVTPERGGTVTVGSLSVVAPRGAVTTSQRMTITRPTPAGATSTRVQRHFSVSLERGAQPERPIRIEYRLAGPLPEGSEAVVTRGKPGARSRRVVLPTRVSPDRRTIIARTTHLSPFTAWVLDVDQFVGQVLSTRGARPKCAGDPPEWVDDVIHIDQQGSVPMFVCSGSDPNDPSVAVVKMTNNRPTGISLTSSKPWAWRWFGGAGGIKATAGDWFANFTDPDLDRTLFIAPGQQLHLGFTRPSDASPTIKLQGTVSNSAVVFGMAWDLVEDTGISKKHRWTVAGVIAGRCATDTIVDPLAQAGEADALELGVALGKCVVEDFPVLVKAVRDSVDAETWAELSPSIYGAGNTIVRRANMYLTGFSAIYTVMDMTRDLLQHPGARAVLLTAKLQAPPVGGLLVPAGTCSLGNWDQYAPVQLAGGQGEAFDSAGRGTSVLAIRRIGTADVTGDGTDELFVSLTCAGSPIELCCAGRTSTMEVVAVLDVSRSRPQRVGNTIWPIDEPGGAEGPQPMEFQAGEVALDGTAVVTRQRLIYPDSPEHADASEREVRYDLQDGRWEPIF